MQQAIVIYLIAINLLTFIVYGIDKWRSTSGRLLPSGRKKAKRSKWRIPEATLLGLAVIGGSIGAWLGMRVWHHKTLHKKFRFGIPMIIILQIAFVFFASCGTKQKIEPIQPISETYQPEHSPNVFLVTYDAEIGKEPLLKAIKDYKV